MSDDIREEQFLADIRSAAQGEDTYYNLDPIIRKEFYYADIIEALKNGGGGGGGGFEPTDEQLAAMNSGITADKLQEDEAKTTGMSEGGSNYITVGGIRVYVSATAPTGARVGDLWIGG